MGTKKELPYISFSFIAASFFTKFLNMGSSKVYHLCTLSVSHLRSLVLFKFYHCYNYHCSYYQIYTVMPPFSLKFENNTSSLLLDFSTWIFQKYFKFNMIKIELISYLLSRPSICFCPSSVKRTTIWPVFPAKCICLPWILPSHSLHQWAIKSSYRISLHYFPLSIPTITLFRCLYFCLECNKF